MPLTKLAVENKAFTYFFTAVIGVAGVFGYFSLGQLEDPEFSIKSAKITTIYPGASPEEVELEVTDPLEIALQELAELKHVESTSRAGESVITAEIKAEYWSDELPQIWDRLRSKIDDAQDELPDGALTSMVNDDVGKVYGLQLAVVGEGFTPAELEEYANFLRKELSVVEGVSRVDLWGERQRVIYFDVAETQLAALGLTSASIQNTLEDQNLVVDPGSLDVQRRRLRIAPTGAFTSPSDIGELTIRAASSDLAGVDSDAGATSPDELIRLRDIGTIREGYEDPPQKLMRFNGRPAIGLSITNAPGANVVKVGEAVDARLAELNAALPVGIEVNRVHWMSDVVDEAVMGFLESFALAVAIVIIVITIGMGLRMSIIIGTALIMTILGSFAVMSVMDINLQRMSRGALIIALGMMVDNAVVVADGMNARLKRGVPRREAAIAAGAEPSLALLGATIIGAIAFYPIYASTEGAGEYCRTLFTVIAASLLVSWLVSVTLTPLQCIGLVKDPKSTTSDPYQTPLLALFRKLLVVLIKARLFVIAGMIAALVFSLGNFGQVKQLFFPDSSMTKFMIDIYGHEGTRIQTTQGDLIRAEQRLQEDDRITDITSFIGQGPPRFYLPVEPEPLLGSYAQMIVSVEDESEIDGLITELYPWFTDEMPDSLITMRKFGVGPSNTWSFELRISGPAIADPETLRSLADQAVAIVEKSPYAGPARTDWREQTPRLEPRFNQERARWASVGRDDISNAIALSFDGQQVGTYREGDDLLPIIMRRTEAERQSFETLDSLQVNPSGSTVTVPLAQVTDGIEVAFEDTLIGRYNRRRMITVEAAPAFGASLNDLRNDVLAQIEAIELPPGYTMEWGGEYEDTADAQASLIPGLGPMAIIILSLLVALFNAYRPLVVMLLTLPFVMIGVTWGFLIFDAPFGFVALLALMSLIGMMLKNAIVLIDEVEAQLEAGQPRGEALIRAAQSRLSPVVLASATTVLGVIPLLSDNFWIGLSVTIMAGLSFGTLLTMVFLPVLYSLFYGIKTPPIKPPATETATPAAAGDQGTGA
ncbi:MAG: efflux RND transporter permease subunit [Planctomycetota bacterium]